MYHSKWFIMANSPDLQHHRLINTIHLTLKMTSAEVVETSVTNNSSFQNYTHSDDHTIRTRINRVNHPVNAWLDLKRGLPLKLSIAREGKG